MSDVALVLAMLHPDADEAAVDLGVAALVRLGESAGLAVDADAVRAVVVHGIAP